MSLPAPKGFKKLSPSELKAAGLSPKSRAVLDTGTGEIISRRRYENLRIELAGRTNPQHYGWRSWSDFQRSRKSPVYQHDLEKALEAHPDLTAKDLRRIDSEFNELFADARPYWNKRKSAEYRNPNGPVATFLVYLGLRDEDAEYDVGETNTEAGGSGGAAPAGSVL